jgi:very-short-patch-repair endonuclease/transposase
MNHKTLDQEKINEIIELRKQNKTYKEIKNLTGVSFATLVKYIKNYGDIKLIQCRSAQERVKNLTPEQKEKYIQIGKNAVLRNKKSWTTPEILFFEILQEFNLIVKFPKFIEDKCNITWNKESNFLFQGEVQRYSIDFLDEKNKICYEICGDYWHANPKFYDHNSLSKTQKFNVYRDKNKKEYLESKGYKVIYVWQSELEKELIKIRDIIKLNHNILNLDVEYINYINIIKQHIESIVKTHKIKKVKEYKKCYCKECNSEISRWAKRGICHKCSGKNRRILNVTKEEIESLSKKYSKVHIAKMYNVSDGCIRKIYKRYNISSLPQSYWVSSDFVKNTTKEELEKLLSTNTIKELSKMFNISVYTVRNLCYKYELLKKL